MITPCLVSKPSGCSGDSFVSLSLPNTALGTTQTPSRPGCRYRWRKSSVVDSFLRFGSESRRNTKAVGLASPFLKVSLFLFFSPLLLGVHWSCAQDVVHLCPEWVDVLGWWNGVSLFVGHHEPFRICSMEGAEGKEGGGGPQHVKVLVLPPGTLHRQQ